MKLISGKGKGARRLISAVLTAGIAMALAVSAQATTPKGAEEAFGIAGDQQATGYSVQQIKCSAPGNVLWPEENISITYQFVNKTGQPLKAAGKVELLSYGTRSPNPDNFFETECFKIADIGSTPISIDLPPNGWTNITVKPDVPERLGAYATVIDLTDHGRAMGSAIVRVPKASPARVQFPTYAIDLNQCAPGTLAMWERLGIKATRIEVGYRPTTDTSFYPYLYRLAKILTGMQEANISVMLTVGGGGPQPTGETRPWLNENDETIPGKSDYAWLPEYDADFENFCRILAATFGWPHGPVNAIELWNEPWEGRSISGWQADIPRYRTLYTHMAQGIEQARRENGVQVLIGGTCSSMNTDDKLFCDGKDTFLKWLDFTSIHYQPMTAWPALVPSWQERKSPYGAVRVWDTESWMANTEDRVAAVIASMRSLGQSRTAGVLHDAVFSLQWYTMRTEYGTIRISVPQAWSPGCGIAATQHFIGERPFKELLFKNGLPWVYVFGGLRTESNHNQPDPDDGTVVIVGDLGKVYDPNRLLYRNIEVAPDAKMTLTDGGGQFTLYDFYGNPEPNNGRIVVPLNGLGYFLRSDGSDGSFARLLDAIRSAKIEGYEPVDVQVHNFLAGIDTSPELRLTLTNILNRPVDGTLSVSVAGLQLDTPEQTVALRGNETKDVVLKVVGGKAKSSNTYQLSVSYTAENAGKTTHEEDVHVNMIAKRTITVDGKLDDWQGALPQPVEGEAQGPNMTERAWLPFVNFPKETGTGFAIGYLAYDEDNFYFAAKIADDTPYDGNIRFATRDDSKYYYPEEFWRVKRDRDGNVIEKTKVRWPDGVRRFSYRRGPEYPTGQGTDNIQLAFNVIPLGEDGMYTNPPGTMPKYMTYKSTDYEYAFNKVAPEYGGGTEIWRLLAPGVPYKHYFPRQPQAEVDGGPVDNGKLVMIRDGNTRIVEAAIPWSEIPDVKKRLDAGETIKLNFRANNNRGPACELAAERSVSKLDTYALHDLWATSWANEVEFAFEK